MFDFIRKKKQPQPIMITLEELSPIWLKYNRFFERINNVEENDNPELAVIHPQELVIVDSDPGPTTPPLPPSSAPVATSLNAFNTFVQDTVQPYRMECEAQNALNPILDILKLLETEGSCPSIGKTSQRLTDSDIDYISIQDALSQITLRNHSHRVARIAIKRLKDSYRDYQSLVPKVLVCALAHDIGKIPSLRTSDKYVKADHPIIGGAKLREIMSSSDETTRVSWIDSAVKAVESHHRQSKESFLNVLQSADAQAREEEVLLYKKDFVLKEWSEWFSLPDLLESLKNEINVVAPTMKNRWKAFSFNGVVYCKPEALIDKTIEQAKAKKVFDIRLIHTNRNMEAAMLPIVSSLKEIQAIFGDKISPSYYGGDYEIDLGAFKDAQFLIPLNIEVFGLASDIESNKSKYFNDLQGVRLMSGKRKKTALH